MYLWRRVQWHIHIYHSTFFLKLNTLQIFELKRKHVHKKEEIIFVGVNELGELKFVWVGKWIKQIVGQASFVMNACTCFTQFSYIVSHYRHQPTSSSWLCEVEWLYHRILLYTETTINHYTVNHNDLMILYLLILNPIVTSLKPKLFSDIYRACLIMNRRAASYRMLMMICCCCWGGTGCKPPAPRGSETGVSCTACISHEIPHC